MKFLKWSLAGLAAFLVALSFWPRNGTPTADVLAPMAARPLPPANSPTGGLLSYSAAQRGDATTSPAPGPGAVAPRATGVPQVDFALWVDRFLAEGWSGDQAALLTEGERLAVARREALSREIEENPRAALEHAAPYRWRQVLPESITRHLETPVAGVARLDVFMASPVPGADYTKFKHHVYRYATLGGRTFRAYVYGQRATFMSRESLMVHGIAIDDALAIHEAPVRVLDADEAAVVMASLAQAPEAVCAVCAAPAANGQLAQAGDKYVTLCGVSEANSLNQALMASELKPAALYSALPVWTNQPPKNVLPTFGTRRALYMRLVFRDDTTIPISEAQAQSEMDQVNDFYIENSYAKTAVIPTITPIITLPKPKARYSKEGSGSLMADAQAEAAKLGYLPENFDLFLARFTPVPGYDWGGLGGGKTAWIQYNGAGLVIHELGHCYGLGHANFWETRRAPLPGGAEDRYDTDSVVGHDSVIGAGDDIEYGDPFDVMGSGGGESRNTNSQTISSFAGHFNPIGKNILGWLPDSAIQQFTDSGTNRIYVHDTAVMAEGRAYALKIRKDEQRTYWLSARNRNSDNAWLTNGVSLHWGTWAEQIIGYSTLLDTTPGTVAGKQDSAIAIGRTYADRESNIYITPVARGGSADGTYYDVVVNQGTFLGNNAPTASLTASTLSVAVNKPVTFTVAAEDLDGDALAYYWDLSDGSIGANSPTLTRSWSQPGDYRVRVEVSDMKGGLDVRHVVVRVGNTPAFRISGVVRDDKGQAVVNARVANGALTNTTDLGDDFQATFTDSEGAFTLINQTQGDHAVTAFKHGYITKPLNFNVIVTVADEDVDGVEFFAQEQPKVTVRATADADLTKGKAGTFTFTRTGDINTQIRAVFIMKGSAVEGTDFAKYTNTTVHTNAMRTLLANVNKAVNFYFVDFATGVFQTNVTIAAATNATAADEKFLNAAVMYALQKEFSYATNVDDGNGGVTNGLATNYTFMTGWELLSTTGEDTWYQTYGDYVVGSPAEARMKFKAVPATLPVVSIAAISKGVSENGGDSALFVLSRSGKTDVPVDVHLAFAGTASYNSDYVAVPDLITIPAFVTSLALPVYIRPDLYLEGNETISISVVTNAAYKVGTAKAEVTVGDNDLPALTVTATDPVASETGTDNGVVTFTRVGDLTRELTVNYLVGGSALSGRDYRALSGTLTIPAGQPSATLTIQPRDNRLKDGGNTVEIIVSDSPTYNVGTPGVATVFIQDGAVPTVNIRATKDTGAEPADPAEFTLTRAGDSRAELVVKLAVGGTARAVADYAPITSLGRIPAGATSVVVRVVPVNDAIREDTETVICEIQPSPNYNIGASPQAVASITDDDGGGRLGVGFSFLNSVVSEGAKTAVVAVAVSGNPNEDVTVDWRVTGGSALPGIDYPATNASGRLLFTNVPDPAVSNRVQLISLPLLDNTNAQPDRTLVLSLLEPAPLISNEVVTNEITLTNASGEPIGTTNILVTNTTTTPVPMNAVFDVYLTHTVSLLDDDANAVSLEVADATAMEEGRKQGKILVRRFGSTSREQIVNLTVAGTAANGSDYETLPSSIAIPIGDDVYELSIFPVDDPMQEFLENVTVSIVSAPGATISNRTATVNIVDNDGTIEFASPTFTAYEGSGLADIKVHRTSDTNLAANVAFVAVAGTATPTDFVATNGIVSFAPGEVEKSFQVQLLDDQVVEPQKSVLLTLRNLTDGVPLGGQVNATLLIVDDDTEVGLLAARVQAIESDPTVSVIAYRYGLVTNALKVELTATTNGTALPGVDFVATNYSLVFAPGKTTAVAQVKLLDDVAFDGDRQIDLVLTNLEAPAIYAALTNAQVVILDDECSVQLAATDYRVNEFERQVTLTIQRQGSSIHPIDVQYATTNGTATAARDYVAARGTLSFFGAETEMAQDGSGVRILQPGQTNATLTIRILDDVAGEGDETFLLGLGTPATTGGVGLPGTVVLGEPASAVVTIVDNEVPGSLDFDFYPGTGANGPVRTLALQEDAKVVLGGDFTELDEVALSRIARLHDDGYLDTFLNPGEGFDGNIRAVVVQPDGRIVVGGEFTKLATNAVNRLARINADGAIDPLFRIGVGADATVRALALDVDGSILVGGDFTTLNGVRQPRLARLTNPGAVDTAFAPVFDGAVHAVVVQPDGKLLVGGSFASGGGRQYFVRLNADGTTDSSFISVAPDDAVYSVALQFDGKIVVAGAFTAIGDVERNGIARFNADGSLDTEFDPGAGANGAVYAVGLAGDGKVLLGGAFTQFDGADRGHVARLNQNGSLDTGFIVGTGTDADVLTLVVQPDTAVVIGGEFTLVNGVPRNRIARLHGDEKFTVNVIQFSSSFYRAKESAGNVTITLERSGDLSAPAVVQYATADGTATAGSDYVAASGSVSFAANESVKTFTVRVLDDTVGEGDETVKLALTGLPPGYSTMARLNATLTIEDDESAVAFVASSVGVRENDGQASVLVRRTGPTTAAVSVDFRTRDGSAAAGADYTETTGTLTFGVGETEKPVLIPITDDADPELDETFSLELSNPQGGAVLGSLASCVVTIIDNDRVDSYALNITPPVGGTVTPPSGSYPTDSRQTVTALAERGFRFVRWEGTVQSADNPLVITMDRNYRLTAVFAPTQYTYTFEPPFSPLDLRQSPWGSSSTQPWQLQSTVASGGRFAVRSATIGDGQESTLQLVVESRGGAAAFDVRVSSEANWDFAEFLVDGSRVERWSGEVPWQTYLFNLAPGTHTLAWRYVKDNNYAAGLDGIFIDNIFVPTDAPDPTDPAAALSIVSVPNGIQIWLTGKIGLSYTLQESTDLVEWTNGASYLNTTGTVVINVPTSSTSKPKFYRAVTTP